jgi:hypothetical protein
MTENKPEQLHELQRAFAAHIRDPGQAAAPDGLEDRRMKVYRELFFNNILSLLSSNFPVLRTLYEGPQWRQLVRDFYAEHRCQTPLFPEIAREFLRYLQDGRGPREDDPGFLHELAHYEWVELALSLDEREPQDDRVEPGLGLLDGIPLLSPLAWPLSYRYPVHRIRPDYQPQEPPPDPTHLLVYRNREDRVKFMELNATSRLLLERLRTGSELSGRELLQSVAAEIAHPDPDLVVQTGAGLLEDLKDRDVLLGARGRGAV